MSPLTNPSISAPQEHHHYSSLGGLPRDILPLYSHVFISCKILLKKKKITWISLVVQYLRGNGFDPWSGKIPYARATQLVCPNY